MHQEAEAVGAGSGTDEGQSWLCVLLKPREELQQISLWFVRAWSVSWGRRFSRSTGSPAALRLPRGLWLPRQRGGTDAGGT